MIALLGREFEAFLGLCSSCTLGESSRVIVCTIARNSIDAAPLWSAPRVADWDERLQGHSAVDTVLGCTGHYQNALKVPAR